MHTTTSVQALRALLATLAPDTLLAFSDSLDVGEGAAAVCLNSTGAESLRGKPGLMPVSAVQEFLAPWAALTPVRAPHDFGQEGLVR